MLDKVIIIPSNEEGVLKNLFYITNFIHKNLKTFI